jgi:hypothetical protein
MQYLDGVFVQNHEEDYPRVLQGNMHLTSHLPSDFHLFCPPKGALRGRPFSVKDDMKETVHDWLGTFSLVFFSDGIKKPMENVC